MLTNFFDVIFLCLNGIVVCTLQFLNLAVIYSSWISLPWLGQVNHVKNQVTHMIVQKKCHNIVIDWIRLYKILCSACKTFKLPHYQHCVKSSLCKVLNWNTIVDVRQSSNWVIGEIMVDWRKSAYIYVLVFLVSSSTQLVGLLYYPLPTCRWHLSGEFSKETQKTLS